MRVILSSGISIPKDQISNEIADLIRDRFTYQNPVFMKNAKLGFRNWGVSQTLSLLRDTGDYYRLPRGCLGQVGQLVEIEIENQTIENPVDFPPSSLSLRPYQQTAVNALLQSNQGLLVAPCGAGKTEIGCDLIHIRCQKTLIITHMKDLVQQWAERISSKLNIEAGIIGAGRWDDSKAVTVATVQSLRNCLQPSFVNQFGMVVLDECHHAPAKTFCEILNLFPARCRYGLSATPTRADGLEFLMYAAFGRILHEITDADMGADHTTTPSVVIVETGCYLPSVDDYSQMLEGLFRDEARNTLIVETVAVEALKGHHSCLVLSQRISHIALLSKKLSDSFPTIKTRLITGKEPQSVRQQALDDMRSGIINVLFSCKLADEGLDIPRLDRMFLTAPIRSVSRLVQQIGRIKRPFPGKHDAVVYDFLDSSLSMALSQFYTRSKVYKSQKMVVEKANYGSNYYRKAA